MKQPGPPPTRRPYAAPALLDLAEAGLRACGRLQLRVVGDSMAPLLGEGDTVTVEPAEPGDLRRGDVLVIRSGSTLVTHRLVAVDDRGWRLKGDNTTGLDEPVPAAAIVGRVILAERGGRRTDFRAPAWRRVNRCLGDLGRWEARMAPARDRHPPLPARMIRALIRRLARALLVLPEISPSS